MHVAVAIVGFRNRADILNCLAALERSVHDDFELIICENGGTAAYANLIAALPDTLAGGQKVRAVMAPGNLGYAGGVNTCLRETPDADAWWILNPDTVAEPEAMGALIERLSVGDCQAVGGALCYPDGTAQSFGGRWWPWIAHAESLGFGQSARGAVDVTAMEAILSYLSGACMLVSRDFLRSVGPMREDYFLYCEEVEWCLRARRLGMGLGVAPHARVVHLQGTTTGFVDDLTRRPRLAVFLDMRNRLLLTWDCFPSHLPVVAVALLALLSARFARRGAWRQCRWVLSGWAAGILNRRGPPAWIES